MSDGNRDQFIENDVLGNVALGTVNLGRSATRKRRKKAHKSRRKNRTKRKRSHRKSRKRRHNKRKRSSKGGIKYTKNGQPYKIMPNGRARFLKK